MNDIKLGTFQVVGKNVLENFSFNNEDVTLINFNLNHSIKIIPFFEKIQKKEVDELINVFKSLELDLRLDDMLGKLHIVLLKLLLDSEANKVLIIDDVGFTSTSINFLESNFNNIMPRFKNKSIIILDRGESDSQGFQLLI